MQLYTSLLKVYFGNDRLATGSAHHVQTLVFHQLLQAAQRDGNHWVVNFGN